MSAVLRLVYFVPGTTQTVGKSGEGRSLERRRGRARRAETVGRRERRSFANGRDVLEPRQTASKRRRRLVLGGGGEEGEEKGKKGGDLVGLLVLPYGVVY